LASVESNRTSESANAFSAVAVKCDDAHGFVAFQDRDAGVAHRDRCWFAQIADHPRTKLGSAFHEVFVDHDWLASPDHVRGNASLERLGIDREALAVLEVVRHRMRSVDRSYSAIDMFFVPKISRILSPTRSTIAWKSSCAASPSARC
jgi:hypothetical protein